MKIANPQSRRSLIFILEFSGRHCDYRSNRIRVTALFAKNYRLLVLCQIQRPSLKICVSNGCGSAGSGPVQTSLPPGFWEAPEPLSHGHDRSRDRPTPLLPVRRLQVPGRGFAFPQRGELLASSSQTMASSFVSPLRLVFPVLWLVDNVKPPFQGQFNNWTSRAEVPVNAQPKTPVCLVPLSSQIVGSWTSDENMH